MWPFENNGAEFTNRERSFLSFARDYFSVHGVAWRLTRAIDGGTSLVLCPKEPGDTFGILNLPPLDFAVSRTQLEKLVIGCQGLIEAQANGRKLATWLAACPGGIVATARPKAWRRWRQPGTCLRESAI